MLRQKEGIAAQKANGTYSGGRPTVKVDKKRFAAVYDRWKSGEITAAAAFKELGMTKTTFYRRVKEYERQ